MRNAVCSLLVTSLLVAGTSACHKATPNVVRSGVVARSGPAGARATPVSPDDAATPAQRNRAVVAAVLVVLGQQRDAWNRGDLEAFMKAYVHDDTLVFTSGGNVRRGWDETMRRYRARYVDAAAMGKLTFSDLETTVIAEDAALVLGKWRLDETPEAGHGVFTLVFVQRDGAWQILHDHTSAGPQESAPATP